MILAALARFSHIFSVIQEKCWHGTLNSHQLLPSKSSHFIHYCSTLVPYNLRYNNINETLNSSEFFCFVECFVTEGHAVQ